MSMSTFQKVTLVSCLVLCVSLLLPKMLLSRGKKEVGQPEVGPGRFPPMMHRQQMPDGQWGAASPYSRSHSAEAIAKAKGGGIGGGGKSNLMGQIIPIYGFGILLYILYILFKITSKGKIGKPQNRFPALKSENMKRKITDYELAQLQEKLRETEEVMERIVSKAGHSPDRIKTVTVEHEEKLLRQLKEITRVMQEGKLVEGIDELSPEMEAEEASYTEDWEGYPEETYPVYDEPGCRQRYDTIILEKPETELLSPEELAERMEEEAEEIGAGPEPDQAESEREEAGPDRDEAKPDRDAAVTDREEAEPDRNTAEPYREEAEPDRNTAEPDREEAEPDRNTAEPDREEAELCLPEAPPQNSEVKRAEPRLRGRKQISFSEHRDIYHYPKECISDDCDKEEDKVDEEEEEDAQEEEEVPEGEEVKEGDEEEEEVEEGDEEEEEGDDEEEEGIEEEEMEEGDEVDPVVMAESLSFSCQECSHVPELEDAEEVLHTDDPQGRVCQGESVILTELGPGMLRKRNKKEPE